MAWTPRIVNIRERMASMAAGSAAVTSFIILIPYLALFVSCMIDATGAFMPGIFSQKTSEIWLRNR